MSLAFIAKTRGFFPILLLLGCDVGVYFLFEAVEFLVEIFFGDLIFRFGGEFGGGFDGILFGGDLGLALAASAHGKDKCADDSESNNYL